MTTRTRNIVLAVALIVIAIVVVFGQRQTPPTPITTVVYSCAAGKGLTAAFYRGESKPASNPDKPPIPGGSVVLTFPNGSTVTLAQTVSADGNRYANADESFVFWGKGNSALVLEDGQQKTYTGCIAVAPEPVGQNLPLFYSNSTAGFSIRFQEGFAIDQSYRYQELGPGKDIYGIKFTIPATMATGTNLAADSYLSVEGFAKANPPAPACTASRFLERATASTITDEGVTYSVATSTGAAAGNRYEEMVFALPGTNPCIAVRYFIHYGVFENYPLGTVRLFNEQALLSEFDAMRHTLVVAQ